MVSCEVNFADIADVNPRPISCMRLNEKTKQLALYRGGDFGSIELWDVSYQPFLIKQLIDLELVDGKPSVESIVWVQGRLFSAGLHGFIVEHDLSTGKIKSKVAATSGPVWCLAVNPAQSKIAAGTEDGFINIFDVVSDGLLYQKVLDRQEGRVLCLDWTPCGNHIASGSVDSVRLWDVDKGHAIQRLITGRSKNRETIVWAIVALEDLTIVSGDSRGIVSFWDGRVGVLKSKLVTHKADILTLKLSQDKTQLYAAGVDPTVIIINRINNSDKWIKSHPRAMHTNDVMTLECHGNRLFSGGMDSELIMSSFPPKIVTKIPPLPQQPFVFQSENRVLVSKENSVAVWRLPTKDQDLQKLLEFQTKGNGYIYSTGFSSNGKYFAISTLQYIRIFHVQESHTKGESKPTLTRLRINDIHDSIPNTFWHLKFLTNEQVLAFSADGCKLLLLTISDDDSVEVSECVSGPFVDDQGKKSKSSVDMLAVNRDGSFFSVNDNGHIAIYKMNVEALELKKICSVPSYFARLTNMNFHPEKPLLLLTFSDSCIQVYDFGQSKIVFCEKLKKKFDDLQPILGSSWICNGSIAVMFQVDSMFMLKVDINEEPLKKSRKGANPKARKETYDFFLKTCERKFKYLAQLTASEENSNLLAVEVNPNSILEKLPTAFARKRFGA